MAAGETYNPVSLVNREKMCSFILLDAKLFKTASLYLPSPSNVKTSLIKSQGPTLKATAPPECEGQM